MESATNKLKIVLTNNGSSVTGTVTSFNVTSKGKRCLRKSPSESYPVQLLNQVILKASATKSTKNPWSFPEIKDQNLWPGKQMVTFAGSYTYDEDSGHCLSNFCAIYVHFGGLIHPCRGIGWRRLLEYLSKSALQSKTFSMLLPDIRTTPASGLHANDPVTASNCSRNRAVCKYIFANIVCISLYI